MPRERESASHIFSPSPTSSDQLATTKRSSARILSLGDGNAPAYLQLANIWMILKRWRRADPGATISKKGFRTSLIDIL
jgi:hypothetical protein